MSKIIKIKSASNSGLHVWQMTRTMFLQSWTTFWLTDNIRTYCWPIFGKYYCLKLKGSCAASIVTSLRRCHSYQNSTCVPKPYSSLFFIGLCHMTYPCSVYVSPSMQDANCVPIICDLYPHIIRCVPSITSPRYISNLILHMHVHIEYLVRT